MDFLTTNPFDDDKLKEECGVFGIWGDGDASRHVALGLHALQHRGQEAAGIVSYDGEQFHAHRDIGQVADIFGRESVMVPLKGKAAIGHVRYSTAGGTLLRNVQPLFADLALGGFCLAHNGNLTNATGLRRGLVNRGAIFQSTADTECIIHLIALAQGKTVIDRLNEALRQIEGAYSLVCLTDDCVIGVRDPLGVRPLVIGRRGSSYIVTSETCALDIIGADYIRDVEPGEMVILDASGVHSLRPFPPAPHRFSVFEYIYFARPDSSIEGKSVYQARKKIGEELARESGVEADVIIPVPDSGVPAAIGYSQESGIPFELGIIRNHYVGRTFIEPEQRIRKLGVKLKHSANRGIIRDKRLVLIDDSVVRGTTSQKIVQLMFEAGAKEVHMRISSPPITHPDFYGIDTPSKKDLLAANMSVAEMCRFMGATSLAFLSVDGIYRAVGLEGRDARSPRFTDHCFTGDYPTTLTDQNGSSNVPRQLSLLAEAR